MNRWNNLALVDTNVLVYALYKDSAHYVAARSLLDRAQKGEIEICLIPQILAEFYSVVSDPRRVTKAREPKEILLVIEKFLSMPGVTLLTTPVNVVERWIDLLSNHAVTGGAVFDVLIVATMIENNVRSIYTFNIRDFKKFKNIEVLTP